MTVRLMRFVDRFVGVPLCLFLGYWKKYFGKKRRDVADEKIQNILVIKFFGMGSIILLTPTLREIKNKYPNAKITFLSFKSNGELLKRISSIDSHLSISTETPDDFVRSTFSLIKKFRDTPFDVVFDFEFFSKFSTLLSALTNAPQRLAFALPTRWRAMLVTEQIPLHKTHHVAQCFLSFLYKKNELLFLDAPKIFESEVIHFKYLCKELWGFTLGEKQIITLNINAGKTFLERRWSANNFTQLVQSLPFENVVYFFIGDESERRYVDDVVKQCRNKTCFNLAGALPFGEFLVLLKHSSLLITNDSGPLHLASSLGTRTLSLYGPESPEFYGPIGEQNTIVYKKISCSPCMNVYDAKSFRCPYDAQCMKDISVEEVKAEVEKMFNFV